MCVLDAVGRRLVRKAISKLLRTRHRSSSESWRRVVELQLGRCSDPENCLALARLRLEVFCAGTSDTDGEMESLEDTVELLPFLFLGADAIKCRLEAGTLLTCNDEEYAFLFEMAVC
jgi:hypothetical protein